MVHRHLVVLAALLVEPEPPPLALRKIVLDPHRNSSADPRETVDQYANERPIPKTNKRVSRDAIEKLTRLLRRQHRRLAPLDNVLGPEAGFERTTWPTTSQSEGAV